MGPAAQRSPLGAEIWHRLLASPRMTVASSCSGSPPTAGYLGTTRPTRWRGRRLSWRKKKHPSTSVYRAATRLAKYLTARERPSHPGGARAATGWYRVERLGERFPPPIAGTDRTAAVYVHQMRPERWSGSAQLLHEIGRNRHRTACPRAAPAC